MSEAEQESGLADGNPSPFLKPLYLALFVVGICGLIAVPIFAEVFRPTKVVAIPKQIDAVEIWAFNSDGPPGPAGWLEITYHDKMRNNEEAPIVVGYVAQGSLSSRGAAALHGALSVDLSSISLTIGPEPKHYGFDGYRLTHFGNDSHFWGVSAKSDGDYRIFVQFHVPNGLLIKTVVNNGAVANGAAQFALPVKVETPYPFWEIVAEAAKYVGAILSFVLTLPYITSLVAWYRGKKRKRKRTA